MKIKYDASLMQMMNTFSSITKAELKDCFLDNRGSLVYVVKESQLGKALGRNAQKVRSLERATNRKIKIVEFNPDLIRFIRNFIYPLRAGRIDLEDKTVIIEPSDLKTRGKLIGRAAQNLREIEASVKRYFDIDEIKVM